MEQSEVGYDN